jgi:branched-chain amino acid transport system permease protein
MSVGDRVPDRVPSVANSDPAMIVGLLAVIYAVYLIAGSIIGTSPVTNLMSLTKWIGLFALGALALNLHWGYTGLFNIGIVAFMGVGVHVTAIVSKEPVTEGSGPVVSATGGLGLPLPIGMLAGAVAAALFGLVIALPALRLRADYLAIVTVAVSEIFRLVVRNGELESAEIGGLYLGLGGGDGLQLDWGSEAELLFDALFLGGVYDGLVAALDGVVTVPQTAVDRIIYGLILLVFVLLYYALLQRLGNSPFGRVLKAIREDEEATNSLGKDTNRFKIIVFMVGCGLMGLLGVLWFMNAGGRGNINHTQFRPTLTFFIWVALIIGGAGSNTGSVIGGAVFAAVLFRGPRFLQDVLNTVTKTDLDDVARGGGLGEAMAPIAGSFDVMPLLLYTAAKIPALQLLVMGLVIIYLMHNRPDGLLGHRKEQAAAISLSPPDRRSGGERAVAADGGMEDE